MSDLPYDDPVLRPNTPSDSLSTEYGPDETTQAEKALSTADFTCRVESTHHFYVAREAELVAERPPLLPPLNQGDENEKVRFEQVMLTLRRIVAQVEEELSFDATLTRSSPCSVREEPRTTDDLVALMQGLMGMDSDQDRARTPSTSRGHVSISSPMILDAPHAPRHALPYNRTIGFAAGKEKLWAK